jgi:putative transposase
MARPPRFQYPGAVYHVMARGDGGKGIFVRKEDHESFLHWLERVCQRHGWRVHAWVLMGNHFHLLLETPEANQSAGMRVLLGTFREAWNSRYRRRGDVFQGRYKVVPVAGERAEDAHYFKSVADYIHLNPARAGLVGGERGRLLEYPWSSLRHFPKGNAPEWQPMERVLEAFRLSQDQRGRAAYVSWLEARAENLGGNIDGNAMAAIRSGRYLGEVSFKDKLLALIDRAGAPIRKWGCVAGAAVRAHGESEAERIIRIVGSGLGLPESAEGLVLLRKGDPRDSGEGAHFDEERLAGQTALHGPPCGDEPVGQPSAEGSGAPGNPEKT